MEALKILVEFVGGEIESSRFEALLYSDSDLIAALSSNEPIPPYAGENELYVYLISLRLSSPGGILNAKDAVSRFLKTKGIEAHVPPEALDALKLKLAVEPKWLSIPDVYFEQLVNAGMPRAPKDLEAWLKRAIKEAFVSLTKPPKWLQSPEWQFHDGVPMVFVGQLEMTSMRHDQCYAYVFLDRSTGAYKVIEQSA